METDKIAHSYYNGLQTHNTHNLLINIIESTIEACIRVLHLNKRLYIRFGNGEISITQMFGRPVATLQLNDPNSTPEKLMEVILSLLNPPEITSDTELNSILETPIKFGLAAQGHISITIGWDEQTSKEYYATLIPK